MLGKTEISSNDEKCHVMLGNAEQFQEMQINAKKCQEMLRNESDAKKC